MPVIDNSSDDRRTGSHGDAAPLPAHLFQRLGQSVSAKLMIAIFVVLVIIFGLLGYLTIRTQRKHLEDEALVSAEQQSDVLRRSASRYMLRNDRVGLYEMMLNMADQPGMVRVRILNPQGVISYSTARDEVGTMVNKSAEACYGCHERSKPLTRLNRPDRFRIYRANSARVLGVITPIENEPACSNAACHAHPAGQQILGVLDTNLSLAKVDQGLASETRQMFLYTSLALMGVVFLSGLFIWIVVHNPLRELEVGTERLASGKLGYQIPVRSHDEVGELAESFNDMSNRLQTAQAQITAWARTLEERVEEKTRELAQAYQRMLHVEKMATIGKMAAVVAHEINNPLSGILTYSKLVKRWVDKTTVPSPKQEEMKSSLDLIAAESKRCGELVQNLLNFSRVSPINLAWCDLNQGIERCLRLVQHKLEMSSIHLNLDLQRELPEAHCDPMQIEQVVLAIVINAIDAMPQGGNLWISTRLIAGSALELVIRDDGVGIPEEHLSHIFEPFYTTKESGGSGLGLAISQSIVERHGGHIEAKSTVGVGTTFRIVMPRDSQQPAVGNSDRAGQRVARQTTDDANGDDGVLDRLKPGASPTRKTL